MDGLNLMEWYVVTREQYNAGTPKDNGLYFITGENVIYRGTQLYTKAIEFYTGDNKPTNPAPNRIYMNSTTFVGSVYNGTEWVDVIKPASDVTVDEAVTAEGTNAVSGKAVATYVATEIAKVLTGATWDPTEHMLTFPKGFTAEGGEANEVNIVLTGLGVSLQYVKATGKLSLLDASGNELGEGVNLDLDRFVTSGEYDAATKTIKLFFDAEKTDSVSIPVAEIMAISKVEGNALQMKEDGLYVAIPNLDGKMDKPTDTTENNIAVFDANGNVKDSGKSFDDIATGGHAVYRGTTLEEAITGKTPQKDDIAIVSTTTGEGETAKTTYAVHIYDGTNWACISDTAITGGGSTVEIPADKIATSTTIADSAETASDEKVVSEKAMMDKYEAIASAMTWKTEM